jgi:hypothetical protein
MFRFRKSWVLALGLALVSAVSIAQVNVKKGEPNSVDTFDNCMAQPNLINNCRFDTGDFTGWTVGGDTSFTSVQPGCGHSGNFCAFLGPTGYNGTLTQCFTAGPGPFCTLSFWMGNSGNPSHFGVEWRAGHEMEIYYIPNTPQVQWSRSGLPGGGGFTCLTLQYYNVPSFLQLTDITVQCP